MRTLLSDSTNDIALGPNKSVTVINGIDAIAQSAEEYMRTRLLEMVFNQTSGIPFDPVVWDGSPNVAQFEASGRARLLEVPGVVEVISFEAIQNGDILNYVAVIKTTSGETTING